MNKQLSINLFLAKAMKLSVIEVSSFSEIKYAKTLHKESVFQPHKDKSQWAEVLLWAADNDITSWIRGLHVAVDHHENGFLYVACQESDSSRMQAALEAIARSLGWKEVSIDSNLERIKEALESKRTQIPPRLSVEEIRQFILDNTDREHDDKII